MGIDDLYDPFIFGFKTDAFEFLNIRQDHLLDIGDYLLFKIGFIILTLLEQHFQGNIGFFQFGLLLV